MFNLQHRADLRPNTSSYDLAESCVFSKQPLPPFCAARLWLYNIKILVFYQNQTLFIPRLLSYFAEFLKSGYSITLIFLISLPVSVYSTFCLDLFFLETHQ